MIFNKSFLDSLLKQAAENPRLRQNFDLRTSPADTSQRMLNALLPGTAVPIHCHTDTTETVICLYGKLDEIIYEKHTATDGTISYRETQRIRLYPTENQYGCQIPKGAWHTVVILEPSVIFEAKDGMYVG